MEDVEKKAKGASPKLIPLASVPRIIDFEKSAEIAKSVTLYSW